jgi:hypothetical protein
MQIHGPVHENSFHPMSFLTTFPPPLHSPYITLFSNSLSPALKRRPSDNPILRQRTILLDVFSRGVEAQSIPSTDSPLRSRSQGFGAECPVKMYHRFGVKTVSIFKVAVTERTGLRGG